MRLIIAEKPSLARAIAQALPGSGRRQDGYIDCGDTRVTWCFGHLLEQAEPEAYDPRYKRWHLEHLPIIPDQWQLKPRADARKQLSLIKKLAKESDQLVHAGDPDREGQLLVDEVISTFRLGAARQQQVQRLLVSDLTPAAITRALKALRPNSEFIPLSVSALARSRADWLYGINMTRLCTLKGRQAGYQGVLSIGRVQTPLLALVVQRDASIASFSPHDYFEVDACMAMAQGRAEAFRARWQPSEACEAWCDEEGRVLSARLADHVATTITNQPATVSGVDRKQKRQGPPLPYNLSTLQIDAAKRFGMSAQQVLDTCQALYERHTLITYPRSDCRYLPKDQHGNAPGILASLAGSAPSLRDALKGADSSRESKAWNTRQVGAHHAIIPTGRALDADKLSQAEQRLFELIARQYIAQFHPAWCFQDTRIELRIEGGTFVANERIWQTAGWKALFQKETTQETPNSGTQANPGALDDIKEGATLWCLRGERLDRTTQAPAPFTDASLLSAMTNIARFVTDAELRKVLRDTDGLGTEATRASIIELLFKRSFLRRDGKSIRASEAGKALVSQLPASMTTPDMTARWEAELNAISRREAGYQGFMTQLVEQLTPLIETLGNQSFTDFSALPAPPGKKATGTRRRTRKSSGGRSRTTGKSPT
ncbi:DNA topoisomerase III [Larsenimonas rhizosphaerae]|uniref:DNA topoisomerase n=1 Tax=Larsenimonas rhizosphaerae TaxID=2944682 RepID=A0AA42CU15_9GAMM|nr:DNA topoisomerase III [Larsenimonas rhizosphaerae]MCX2523626.1 DNA topoisomerase III [Larsenimonas rhizosphaerae]